MNILKSRELQTEVVLSTLLDDLCDMKKLERTLCVNIPTPRIFPAFEMVRDLNLKNDFTKTNHFAPPQHSAQ
jgi:hypothetical protein